ncbi:MAG: alpha/beta fold hydrolase [Cyanobacteria bacterium J06635_15]
MAYPQKILSIQIESEAQQALEKFLTPSKKPLSELELGVLAQATSFTVPFESINLNAFCWGTGPTVLLVHGWGGYGLQLGHFIEPLLNAGYRVLAFDAPAHGSTVGVKTSGLEIAQAIATIVQHQAPITRVIAHSIGAASTTLALSDGMQIDKVVYLGPMCWLSNAAKLFARRARLSADVREAFLNLFETQFGQDIWQRFSVDQIASKLSVPALLFHDRHDRDVSIEEGHAIAKAWSGARLIETSGLGHRRILRNEWVIQQAVDFIAV